MPLFTQPNQHGVKGLKKVLHTVAGSSVVVKNLRAYLIAQGVWDGVKPIDLTLSITGSVWSNDKTVAAIQVLAADFPASMKIRLDNAGLICGKGDWSPAGGALSTNRPIIVANTGSINGGGYNGSGSGGNYCCGTVHTGPDGENGVCNCCGCCTSGSGSTGYGYGYSSAGSPQTNGGTGSPCGGMSYSCGSGDQTNDCNCPTCPGGSGGSGSGPGSSGYAVSGNFFITWVATGTRNGAVS